MKKHAIFPFLVSAAALACGIAVFISLVWYEVIPLYGQAVLFFLPAAVLSGIGLLALRGHLGAIASAALTLVLSAVFVFLSFLYLLYLGFTASDSTIELQYYTNARRILADRPGVAYFPAEVPEDALEAEFLYRAPDWDDGEEVLMLSFTAADLSEYLTALEKAAEVIRIGEDGETVYVLYEEISDLYQYNRIVLDHCTVTVSADGERICFRYVNT